MSSVNLHTIFVDGESVSLLPFCRVCGQRLTNPHARLHPECRVLDKRNRVALKAELERKRRLAWLKGLVKLIPDTSMRARLIERAERPPRGRPVKSDPTLAP